MRRPFIAGNWKMNLNASESAALADSIATQFNNTDIDIAICPSFGYLATVANSVDGTSVSLGAQNLYPAENGAYTGEVSPAMLLDLGCEYVILGHSERRHILNEDNQFINLKTKTALSSGLRPIVCVGELLEEREAGQTKNVVNHQLLGSLADISATEMALVTIAYEPVWAIGTGEVATPGQAEEVHHQIRALLTQQYGKEIAVTIRIQYGGSVKPENAAELLGQPNIDGALVGGAALTADSFLGIIANAVAPKTNS